MNSYKNLIIGFSSIIIFTTILGITSIYKMLGLSELTENMYKHPFTVSNAIANIETESIRIQHKMQIIMNTTDISTIHKLDIEIDVHHNHAEGLYKLIYDRYLGDVKDIDKSYNAFKKWRELRENIINSLLLKKIDEALTEKKEETLYVQKLRTLISTLKNFAHNKAISYNNNAKKEKEDSIIIIILLLVLIASISVAIAIFVISYSLKSTKDINRHFHLIEQNVNMATLNLDTSVKDLSASLARLFNLSKKDLISSHENLLLGSNLNQINEIKRIIESGKSWNGDIHLENIAWINVDIQPILDQNYKISGYNFIASDITSKKQLEIVSMTDGMTGLYNRREFDKTFQKRLNLARREKKLLIFMMLDIDYFKPYNDNYGHQHGDTALKNVANALKNVFLRPDDAIYRLGGEEFGVLFSANDQAGVEQISQKVLDTVTGLNIEHKHSAVADHVTISIGVGIIEISNIQSADNIYQEVDGILYEAKDNGRNRYEILSI